MRVIVTAGPTREYIDSVRFITNASSGQMGCALAAAAAADGHEVTLLLGEGASVCLGQEELARMKLASFVSVQDLHEALLLRFGDADALIMAAAVGDFRPEVTLPFKLRRRSGPVTLKLYPTEDILADIGKLKQPGQIIIAFAVEDLGTKELEDAGEGMRFRARRDNDPRTVQADMIETARAAIEAKAREEMIEKNADFVVLNTPSAMAQDHSAACILSRTQSVLPWSDRPKRELAECVVALLRETDEK